ncbi:acyl-CoA dehydrogenase family protein [Gammaproteobacteria bacterium]|jgi:acyl-CoA dehydrogenase|nr:acyl-CoA dehydrogenase family protein [Gammaproteobacteria bacterium]MDB4848383.1 acyl-CoA dehydrogenase family protein [Gammaproteobacteria bacterium]MDC0401540.1 acyl-CoA dehydrogenase family protein [Gammaproteobacteria bacterium]MDC1075115.1 acyl-CoA dehydrogenase family protein [Gammaproteobacteria bacterium]MDC6460039.1 acyl-CoA dehydrogenase family protein [Gammaproteobacteria bacterium]
MLPKLRPEAEDLISRVKDFIEKECVPVEYTFHEQIQVGENRWKSYPPIMNELKDKAKSLGLWNLFLPESEFGAGLTNYEYAHLAEAMGTCHIASEAMNCQAPDTGNMEVIARYGNEDHQKEWLQPLLDGEIRSAFGMTEPGVASSDATNMQASAVLDGDEYVINGEKWWTSGAGDPRCKIIIFMAVTNPDAAKHQRHSMMLVPMESEGIEIKQMMHVFGYDDAPHGHAHIKFNNVRIPKDNLLLGEGRGFEIAQGRLGPGRIHHCMRTIGVGERAIDLMCKRGIDPTKMPFGKNIANLGANFDYIAESRIELNAARLLTLDAAHKMDTVGNKIAASEIAQIKVYVPNVVLKIIDRAIQMHGGEGVSQLTPLASMYAHIRTLRLADGPDEVHRRAVARLELGKHMAK